MYLLATRDEAVVITDEKKAERERSLRFHVVDCVSPAYTSSKVRGRIR